MTLRYKLRTLLIALAVLPPLLWIGWTKYEAWKAEQTRLKALREVQQQTIQFRSFFRPGSSAPPWYVPPTTSFIPADSPEFAPPPMPYVPPPVTVPEEPRGK